MRRYRTKPAKTSNPKNRKSNPNEKPKTKSNPTPTLIQIQKKNQSNPIQTKNQSKSNPIQKTTGIQHYETVKHNILPENIALLLRGIFLSYLPLPKIS